MNSLNNNSISEYICTKSGFNKTTDTKQFLSNTVLELQNLTITALKHLDKYGQAHKILEQLNVILISELQPKTKIEMFYEKLYEKNKNNFSIIENDKSMEMKRFIAGCFIIIGIIATGIFPGFLVAGIVYKLTNASPLDLFKPYNEGKNFVEKAKQFQGRFFIQKSLSSLMPGYVQNPSTSLR